MNLVAKEAYGKDATLEQGTDVWKEMQPWLAKNLKPEAKVEVNTALKSGGYTAEVMLGTPEYKGININNPKDLAKQLREAEKVGDTQQVKRITEHYNKFRFNK